MATRQSTALSRRSLLKGAGLLIVSMGAPVGPEFVRSLGSALASGAKPPLHPAELDSYIAVGADGKVTAFFGKMDMGHGLETAIAQMVAEELDVPMKSVRVVMGDTRSSVNQGGASGSTGIQRGGTQMRHAAAEARRVLLEAASRHLDIPADRLRVSDGVVSATSDADKKVSYAELIGGRYFNVKLDWNKQIGNALQARGRAKPKSPKDYRLVGKSIPREDVAPKVFSQTDYITDIKVPGMVHGRMIRPPVAGAEPVEIDESSVKEFAGARVVWKKGFLGVVADKEWDAIRAAEKLLVKWSQVKPPFPAYTSLYDHIRKTPAERRSIDKKSGDLAQAFASAARIIQSEYEWPFQSHASMGPACAVVAIADGRATLWTGGQKPHYARDGVAAVLGMSPESVDGIWVQGPGCYGRNDAGDAAHDAAVLAQAVGRPVRVQYMRHDATAWDPKGPASVHRARAALDAANNVIGYEFISKGFSRQEVSSNESQVKDCLAGHLLGAPLKPTPMFGIPAESYEFPNKEMGWETIPGFIERASPLRGAHLRDPVGPQIHFASESFMDEIAAAIGADPIAFRLKYAKNPRDIAIINAAAEKYGWQARPSPRRDQNAATVTGRGFAYAQRSGAIVGLVAEVEVDKRTGKVWARKFVVSHDCGQIINPLGLQQCIEGNIVQAVSRAIYEEVRFDTGMVTSVDWLSYPIGEIDDAPESIEFALIDRPDVEPAGAGEPAMRPVAAAIANAIFDATGVRLRRVPFTPERVKQALSFS
jgi:CO/xanthine dehydrogenase Mo-binding subunit